MKIVQLIFTADMKISIPLPQSIAEVFPPGTPAAEAELLMQPYALDLSDALCQGFKEAKLDNGATVDSATVVEMNVKLVEV
jgi:hypothetical protein